MLPQIKTSSDHEYSGLVNQPSEEETKYVVKVINEFSLPQETRDQKIDSTIYKGSANLNNQDSYISSIMRDSSPDAVNIGVYE